jgi:hypothetical protein
MTRRTVACLLAVGLVAGLLAGPTASAGAAPCRGKSEVLVLRDFWVEAKPSTTTVKPGQAFTATVTVSRPAHEDPLDQGQQIDPPASVPAEGVNVGISIWSGKSTYFWATGVSDANGQAVMKLKTPKNAEAGPARSVLFAQHWINQSCPDVLENGFNDYSKFLTIKG